MDKLPSIFASYKPHIEKELKEILEGRKLPLYGMVKYHMGWEDKDGNEIEGSGGKYLRATLCLLASESLSGSFKKALPLAAAIELVHNFSLVHDDIQDDDSQRRHKPTVWSIWGKPQAINVGSAMRVMASLSVSRLSGIGIPCQDQLAALNILDENCLKMIEGQYLDIDYEKRENITTDQYLGMVEKKTAALIQAAMLMGSVINTGKKIPKAFGELGFNLGLAFQIKDDVLGIWGNDKKTGKPKASDIRKKKKSFPVVFCLKNLSRKTREKFLAIYNKSEINGKDIESVLEFLKEADARKYSEDMALKYYQKALSCIERLPVDQAGKDHFIDISKFLVKREF